MLPKERAARQSAPPSRPGILPVVPYQEAKDVKRIFPQKSNSPHISVSSRPADKAEVKNITSVRIDTRD